MTAHTQPGSTARTARYSRPQPQDRDDPALSDAHLAMERFFRAATPHDSQRARRTHGLRPRLPGERT